ncbi:MAG: hypothetical protein ABEH77_04865 [Halobacteriaceae archaeon]
MRLTAARVAAEHERLADRAADVVSLTNEVREELGAVFGTDVAPVTAAAYREELDAVFARGDRAVNVAALAALLRELDVEGDYPGFVVDELLGRELAATVAGPQPLRLLAEATFHYADIRANGETAGADDLDAALAAGIQTRLPGWEWRDGDSPF